MSRFLVATMPFAGHVQAAAPLVRALVDRGHEVRWYTGEKYRAKAEGSGARFIPMRAARDFDDADIGIAFPERKSLQGLAQIKYDLKHVFADGIPGQIEDLEAALRDFPADAMLFDPGAMSGPFVSQRASVPFANYGHTPIALPSRDTAPFGLALPPSTRPLGRLRNRMLRSLFRNVLFRDVESHYSALRTRLGFPPHVEGGVFGSFLSPYLFLQATVPSFEYPLTDLAPQVHFIGPMLPAPSSDFTPPAWWDELRQGGRPVVHVTQGTMDTDPSHLILPTLRGLAGEDVLVVATTGGKPITSIPADAVSANARIETFIPHSMLLPHVDVMVTNAGYGGVQVCLSHGVPMVAGGGTEDKPEVANRIAWSGTGINLKARRPKPERIREAVLRVLADPGFRERARAIQAEISRSRAAERAVDLMEELARTKQPVLAR